MIDVSDLRILVCTTPTKMSYSFDSLMGRAQAIFDQDPTSGHLFLFFNRRRDKLKILYWDGDGLAIWYKRLEVGVFQMLTTTNDKEGIEIEYGQLLQLLEGLDLKTGCRQKRFRLVS
jgi:transposase